MSLNRILKTKFRNFSSQRVPLSFSVIGAGPSGLYTAKSLLRHFKNSRITIIDQCPLPYGLVRYGVAPDNILSKAVSNELSLILSDPRCNYLGNIKFGDDLSINFLKQNFNAVILSYGSQGSNTLNVPGENLPGIYNSLDFVRWVNGYPFSNLDIDLSKTENATVIGNGNVALDCARLLARAASDFDKSDLPQRIRQTLNNSSLKNISILGRKAPVDCKFRTAELREIFDIPSIYTNLRPSDFSDYSEEYMQKIRKNRIVYKKLKIFQKRLISNPPLTNGQRNVFFDFNHKIVKFFKKTTNSITSVFQKSDGSIVEMDSGIVIKSIGFKSLPIKDIPFDSSRNVVPNKRGKVGGFENVFVSGWLKNGPNGVISDNVEDAKETVRTITEQLELYPDLSKPVRSDPYELLKSKMNEMEVRFLDKEKLSNIRPKFGQENRKANTKE